LSKRGGVQGLTEEMVNLVSESTASQGTTHMAVTVVAKVPRREPRGRRRPFPEVTGSCAWNPQGE
jgi:hypothetical protein